MLPLVVWCTPSYTIRLAPPLYFRYISGHSSTRVDEGRNCQVLFAIKMKTRTVLEAVVGRGEISLLSAPGSELRVGREKEKQSVRK